MAPSVDRTRRDAVEQLLGGSLLCEATIAMVQLGVPDLLGSGPLTAATLARVIDADADALGRSLRYLAAHGVFDELADGRFGPTELSELLRSDCPGSLAPMAQLLGEVVGPALREALQTVKTGRPGFDRAWRATFYEHLAGHPEHEARWNDVLASRAAVLGAALADVVDWSAISVVVDVGGHDGSLLTVVLARHPTLRGVVFDQPHVVARTASTDRLRAVAGDFLLAVPDGGDLYLLCDVLCDWPDDTAITILRGCRRVMTANARVIICEPLVPADPEPTAAALDVLHLVLTGGRVRTVDEWRVLLDAADLELVTVTSTGTTHAVIEATPSGRARQQK